MRTGQASRTAEHNALFRFLEGRARPDRRLFDDPLAASFLAWPLAATRPLARLPGGAPALRKFIDHRWPGVRSAVVARTRLIDDTLDSLDDGQLAQLVILGAGFDSRPYRLDRLRTVPVFEVDHPDTQREKRRRLARALGEVPGNVTFVPTDFNLGDLSHRMAAAGYRPSAPTVFLWEGTTNYLDADAVDATVRWCAAAPAGSLLLFTYIHADALDRPGSFAGNRQLMATLARVGERFTFGMDPAAMAGYLAARGFHRRWDLGASEIRARYYGDRSRTMVGHEFYRVALADRAP
ncbi:MAG TPA: SAM-dependent methyltransferase [Acidimicrobiales bacterium]|nr:SAM-dependent methyltransferase [Acidimicrobiales bacterium]